MADIELKTNESKYIEFTFKDSDGEFFDLSDFAATIQIQKYGESTLSVSNSCEVTNASIGECRYLYNATLQAGDYTAEIELTSVNGRKYVTPSFDIDVIASLPS